MLSRDLLTSSAFQVNLKADEAGNNGIGSVVLWGRGRASSFDGKDDNLNLNGEITSTTFGMERTTAYSLGGIAVTHSEGRGDWNFERNDSEGGLDASLTNVYPYARWSALEGLNLWGMLGMGGGDIRLKDEADRVTKTDIGIKMVAVGARYQLRTPLDLALKASAFSMEIDSDSAAKLPSVEANAQRARVALEGQGAGEISGDSRIRPGWELGLRWDDGDAEDGTGIDVGANLHYTNTRTGLDIRAHGRCLANHEDKDFEERSAGLVARFDPGAPGRGLVLTLEPEWDETGRSQRIGLDLAGVWKDWGWKMPSGLCLEVHGNRRERENEAAENSVGSTFSFRF